jgi:hypothetical protein
MTNLWGAMSALSAAVGAIVIVIAAIYAHFQVKEARLSRNVALLLAFQDKYHSLPAREFRRRLLAGEFGQADKFDFDRLDAEDFHRLWQLLDQLEVLGVLVDRGLLDFDLVVACFHRSPPMVWNAVQTYVQQRRELASPFEGRYLERLVQRYMESPQLDDAFWARIGRL